jgi:hypothetical protein
MSNRNALSTGEVGNQESRTPLLTGKVETPLVKGDARRIEHIIKGGNPPLTSEKGASPDFRKTNSASDAIKVKHLNRRQALKLKRNRIRGRVNALRSELNQLEPLLSKIEQQLIEMNPQAS